MWAAQRKYEEKHERAQVREDEEMDVGVWGMDGIVRDIHENSI